MVYEYLGIEKDWSELLEELHYEPAVGTEFENCAKLTGVRPLRIEDVDEVENYLQRPAPSPVIANLYVPDESVLGYSLEDPLHAVVIVAIDDTTVTFSDPLSHYGISTTLHQTCDIQRFRNAWMGGFVLLPPAGEAELEET